MPQDHIVYGLRAFPTMYYIPYFYFCWVIVCPIGARLLCQLYLMIGNFPQVSESSVWIYLLIEISLLCQVLQTPGRPVHTSYNVQSSFIGVNNNKTLQIFLITKGNLSCVMLTSHFYMSLNVKHFTSLTHYSYIQFTYAHYLMLLFVIVNNHKLPTILLLQLVFFGLLRRF